MMGDTTIGGAPVDSLMLLNTSAHTGYGMLAETQPNIGMLSFNGRVSRSGSWGSGSLQTRVMKGRVKLERPGCKLPNLKKAGGGGAPREVSPTQGAGTRLMFPTCENDIFFQQHARPMEGGVDGELGMPHASWGVGFLRMFQQNPNGSRGGGATLLTKPGLARGLASPAAKYRQAANALRHLAPRPQAGAGPVTLAVTGNQGTAPDPSQFWPYPGYLIEHFQRDHIRADELQASGEHVHGRGPSPSPGPVVLQAKHQMHTQQGARYFASRERSPQKQDPPPARGATPLQVGAAGRPVTREASRGSGGGGGGANHQAPPPHSYRVVSEVSPLDTIDPFPLPPGAEGESEASTPPESPTRFDELETATATATRQTSLAQPQQQQRTTSPTRSTRLPRDALTVSGDDFDPRRITPRSMNYTRTKQVRQTKLARLKEREVRRGGGGGGHDSGGLHGMESLDDRRARAQQLLEEDQEFKTYMATVTRGGSRQGRRSSLGGDELSRAQTPA